MIQFIISLVLPFVMSLLKLLTSNPAVAAEEATVIHSIASYAAQADMIATPTGTWTYVSTAAAPKSTPLPSQKF